MLGPVYFHYLVYLLYSTCLSREDETPLVLLTTLGRPTNPETGDHSSPNPGLSYDRDGR